MKSIFLGHWIYKCMSYYKYWQKPTLKGALKKINALGILKLKTELKSFKNVWRSSVLVNFQACTLIAGNFTN